MLIKSLCPVSVGDEPATEDELDELFDHYERSVEKKPVENNLQSETAWYTLEQMARVFKWAMKAHETLQDLQSRSEDRDLLD